MGKKLYFSSCIVLVVVISSIFAWSYIRVTEHDNTRSSLRVDQNIYTKTDSQGEVTVLAEWLNPKELDADSLQFDLVMDTHSVNLEEYEILKNTEVLIDNLVINSGFRIEKQGAGHHVSQILIVPIDTLKSGTNLSQAKSIKLVLKNLGNIPQRTFVWNISK